MVARITTDSNRVGLGYKEEVTYGVTPTNPDFQLLEPNSFADTGGSISTVARNPLNPGRQNQKGNITGIAAAVGFETDLTYEGQQDLLQGFVVSTWENKVRSGIVSDVTTSEYTVATSLAAVVPVDTLVFAKGFATANNNGFKVVAGVPTVDNIAVAGLTAEATPPVTATVQVVGVRGVAGDIDAAASTGGNAGRLTSTALDFTTLGLQQGEWIYVGSSLAANRFVDVNNNGFVRIAPGGISTNAIELDKTPTDSWGVEDNAAQIDLLFGDVLKNQRDQSLQVIRSYTFERTFAGSAFEYVNGAVANEFALTLDTEAKALANLSFVARDGEVVENELTGATRIPAPQQSLLNTTSDVARLRVSTDAGLTTYVLNTGITINNGVTANNKVGSLGAIDVTLANFVVSGDLNVCFTDHELSQAVRQNTSSTFDIALRSGSNILLMDLPLITFDDGRPNVEQDSPVSVPVPYNAFEHPELGYTLMVQRFEYAPVFIV